MTRAKICGITREPDLTAVVDAGAHAVGVIADVTVDTPREVAVDRAADLVAAVPPFVASVLVTMPATVDRAVELVETAGPDVVQLHGPLSPAELATVRDRVQADVIAAVDATDDDLESYAETADALLVDSTDDAGGGGTGETHDWTRTREIVESVNVPVILAGGLTPDNVAEAVATVGPFAVDVASGVEATGGEKDHEAVATFVEQATRARVEA